jgi:hypothetical protein
MSAVKYIFLVFVWSYHSKCAVHADAIQIMSIIYTEGGVGLVPKRGCLLTLVYYVFPR